ncbi:sensor histidine kinase [Nocardioides guangzhouensis]|uniref:Sensor histidine kinase n=1 Tax=Nocardioides guangzhouensis TaxID=2497878 RepID=A0A4Q4Z2P3_9ACTN|nr:sensor histidine kinase [Nocardioides guangzhouensis]RYP81920.1 sensor histidine kinase [Nocardioides guangzhouensis]
MRSYGVNLGWAVAGVLFITSGLGLCLRARAYASGGLFAAAGALLIVARFAPSDADAARAVVAAMAVLTAAIATFPRFTWGLATALTLVAVLVGTPVLARQLEGADGLSVGDMAWIAFALATVGGSHLWWRLETAPAETRSSLLWVLSTSGVTLFLIGIVALAGTPTGLAPVVDASLGLIGVAALLGADPESALDGRWLASRAAAWFFSIACVFATATLIFTVIDWRSPGAPGIVAMAVATVVCGILWNPLLRVIQRVSDGVLFGFRPDALTAAQRVAVSISDDPTVAIRAIQEGLVLPYVALALAGEDQIEVGTPTDHRRIFPIDLNDEHIGDLVVGIRPGDLGLSRDDERVVTLSLPILVQTIKARSQAASLQRARVASASAREEERRRLRRDLHDGLGPRLTGIAFTADAARLAATDDATTPMLDRIRHEAEMAINEIRELAYGLRPPALDELGLLGAIKAKTDSLQGLPIHVEASDLPTLPAAVEVAAYRIVMEALTNTARHSGATRAEVALHVIDDCLTMDISDNGNAGGEWVPGIGLTSMRERASELGGTVTYHGAPTGTTVTAELPLTTSG